MSIANTHKNYSDLWYTPPEWLQWVRATLGPYFDPCPANREPDDLWDGLKEPWNGMPTYVNHPGSRGSTKKWWTKTMVECSYGDVRPVIWCAFNCEQLRHLYPSVFELNGYLVMPRERTPFIWGGPDMPAKTPKGKPRVHGQPMTSPGNWAIWWSSVEPAPVPQECMIVRTGCS